MNLKKPMIIYIKRILKNSIRFMKDYLKPKSPILILNK